MSCEELFDEWPRVLFVLWVLGSWIFRAFRKFLVRPPEPETQPSSDRDIFSPDYQPVDRGEVYASDEDQYDEDEEYDDEYDEQDEDEASPPSIDSVAAESESESESEDTFRRHTVLIPSGPNLDPVVVVHTPTERQFSRSAVIADPSSEAVDERTEAYFAEVLGPDELPHDEVLATPSPEKQSGILDLSPQGLVESQVFASLFEGPVSVSSRRFRLL